MKGASQDCILLATNGDIQAVNAGSPIVYIYLHTVQKVVRGKWKMVGEQLCPTKYHYHCIKNILNLRCAMAVRKEWNSVDDCLQFLRADLQDDKAAKMDLVYKIAELPVPAVLCFKCNPPKECLLSTVIPVSNVVEPDPNRSYSATFCIRICIPNNYLQTHEALLPAGSSFEFSNFRIEAKVRHCDKRHKRHT